MKMVDLNGQEVEQARFVPGEMKLYRSIANQMIDFFQQKDIDVSTAVVAMLLLVEKQFHQLDDEGHAEAVMQALRLLTGHYAVVEETHSE